MIQRIQSVFLFLTIVMSLLFLSGAILNFTGGSGEVIKVTFMGIMKSVNGSNQLLSSSLLLTVIIILIPVVSLITIFLYKNRSIQMKLAGVVIALSVFLILAFAYYAYFIRANYNGTIVPGIKLILPVIILVLAVLAFRGIKKDDQLVKSYDRLR